MQAPPTTPVPPGPPSRKRAAASAVAAALLLVLPLSLLLCLQWPLREIVHAWSREANDLAQILFALYVSLAITYASREGTHLAADSWARRYPARPRRILARAAAVCVAIPWSLFVLYASAAPVWQSLRQLESFPETYNPGYFLVKLCIWVLALGVLADGVRAALGRGVKDA